MKIEKRERERERERDCESSEDEGYRESENGRQRVRGLEGER